eukprot:gene54684-20886_t
MIRYGTWLVTFTAARESLEEHTNNLLLATGREAASAMKADLGAGVLFLEITYENVQSGMLNLTVGYPVVHEYFTR